MEPVHFKENDQVLHYKRFLSRFLRNWYWVVGFLAIALITAYLINRYSPKVYPVEMSILIKESQESGNSAEILYNNPLINPYRNFQNELFILKSYPLTERVVRELNFCTRFYKEGNIRTSELYKTLPINIHIINPKEFPFGKTLGFKVVSTNSFELDPLEDDLPEGTGPATFKFNDTISYMGMELLIKSEEGASLTKHLGNEYKMRFTDPKVLTHSYVNRLEADWNEQGASIITLSLNGLIPEKEQDFLNTLVLKYQEQDLSKKVQAAERSLEFIEEQITDISDSLFSYENRLESFKSQNQGNLSNQGERLLTKLESLETNKGTLLIRNNYFEYLQKYIVAGEDLDQAILPSSVGVTDPVLASLVSSMIDLQLKAKSLGSRDNPLVQNTFEQLNNVKQNILESIQNLKSTDQITVAQLDREIKLIEQQLGNLPGAERNFVSIQRNYNLSENLYIFLLQKRYEAGITKASTTSDIEVVNPPRLTGDPVSPMVWRNYLLSLVLGLGLPIGILALLEVFDNKISTKDDIENLTNIPIIATIGHKDGPSNLVVHDRPKSAIAESFRALRSDINYFIGNKEKKTILVTSTMAGEGKTFTVINLATVMAYSGKKVLLIGADMRKPRIFDDFGLTNDFGLSNFLSNQMSFDQIVQTSLIENVDLISGGPIPPNPSELLMKTDMNHLIDEAQKYYDLIILDTPPVAIVTDAFVLSKYADHVLFITRQNYTPIDGVRGINKLLETGKVNNISIVLNDIRNSGAGYGYGYGYGYKHGYYDEQSTQHGSWFQRLFKKA